jgi:hypothetical protein
MKTKKIMKKLMVVTIILFTMLKLQAQVNPDVDFDLQRFIDQKISAGETNITIQPGQYRIKPAGGVHLSFKNLNGITINATGVEMICTETTRAITVDNCQDLTIKGLTIDYDPLPFTQGRIVEILDDKMTHIIELFDGYPTNGIITCSKYEIFKPDSHTLRFGSYYNGKIKKLPSGKLKYTKAKQYATRSAPEKVGDLIVTNFATNYNDRASHAIYIQNSTKTVFDSVTLFGANVFGFFESECNGSIYRNCVVDRRPLSSDLKKRAYMRLRSLNADAFHSKHAVVGPAYLNCTARFQGDDCFAINGDFHMVTKSNGNRIRVLAKRNELDIRKGDSVQIVNRNGIRLPNLYVKSVSEIGKVTKEEQDKIANFQIHERFKNDDSFFSMAYEVELNENVSLEFGSAVCSANRIGNGFRVINCDLGFNRSRGILVKAGDGLIQGNRIDSCWMESIKVTPEFWWMEAGCSKNVTIKNNIIKNSGGNAISVVSKTRDGMISPPGIHQNIIISDNTIRNSTSPQILVTSAKDLLVTKNRIEIESKKDKKNAIQIIESVNTKMSGNKISRTVK